MNIRIHGGTARDDEAALCLSCRYASVVSSTTAKHQLIRCSRVDRAITFKVASCTEHLNRQHPSLYHMDDIAWVLRTDAKRNRIGFVRSRDLKVKDRLLLRSARTAVCSDQRARALPESDRPLDGSG